MAKLKLKKRASSQTSTVVKKRIKLKKPPAHATVKQKPRLRLKKKRPPAIKLKSSNPDALRTIRFDKMASMFPKAKLVESVPDDRRKPFKILCSNDRFHELKWAKYTGGQEADHSVTSAAKLLIEKFGFELARILPTRHKIYKNRDGARLILLTDINLSNKSLSIFKLELRMARSPVSSSTVKR